MLSAENDASMCCLDLDKPSEQQEQIHHKAGELSRQSLSRTSAPGA